MLGVFIYSPNHCEMREIKTAWIITGMPVSPGVGAGGFLEVNVGKDCGDKQQMQQNWRFLTTRQYHI